MKKSVCFVSLNIYPLLKKTSENFIGGSELHQYIVGKVLSGRGYPITYVTLDHGQENVSKIGPFNIVSTYKATEGIPGLRFFYPRLVKLFKALNKTNSDIYIVQCAGILLGFVVYWAKKNNKKVIYRGACDLDFECGDALLKMYRDRLIYFWGLKRVTALIVQNTHQKNRLLENFGRKSVIIYNGMEELERNSSPRDIILWVSNIYQIKGPEIFIEFARQMPGEKFVMVGGIVKGQEKLYEYVLRQSEKLPNLCFKGFLPFEETEKEFNKAKLFVNTSVYEGFPNTFLQAWRQGVPVLSFVDPDGLIEKNSLGLLSINKEDMFKKMKMILSDGGKWNSKHIKNFFDENLIISKQVDEYEKIFNSMFASNSSE